MRRFTQGRREPGAMFPRGLCALPAGGRLVEDTGTGSAQAMNLVCTTSQTQQTPACSWLNNLRPGGGGGVGGGWWVECGPGGAWRMPRWGDGRGGGVAWQRAVPTSPTCGQGQRTLVPQQGSNWALAVKGDRQGIP